MKNSLEPKINLIIIINSVYDIDGSEVLCCEEKLQNVRFCTRFL